MDFELKKYKRLLICIGIVGLLGLQFPTYGFATSTINVTVNPSNVIGTNRLSIGFQLDGADIRVWRDTSTLRELTKSANFTLVRFWEHRIGKPCVRWYESTKTGQWDWTNMDLLIRRIFEAGGEPLIVLGFYSWTCNSLTSAPTGMSTDPKTGLPYPDQWAAYCAEWVKHFKAVGLPVRYYEMINEAFHYFGWPATQPKLSYFMNLYNSAAKAMRAANPGVKIGNDACVLKTVMDYFISNGEQLDFLSYHAYGTGTLSATDAEIFKAAETKFIVETTNVYGVDKAKQLYKAKRGIDLPVFKTEGNLNYHFATGTDPRIQKMQGVVYNALVFRTSMLKGFSNVVYFHFASSASEWQTKSSGGLGFGMVNLDDKKPWYPYYVHKMLGNNLAVGDRIVESSSSSEDMRVVSWIHGGKLNILLILKVNEARTICLKGVTNQVNYLKLDNSVSWKTPKIQTGTISPSNPLTLNGYTVMLLQANTSSSSAIQTSNSSSTQSYAFNDNFETGDFSKWSGTQITSGETVTVVNALPHHGSYGARFTTNGDGGTERAYVYKSVDAQSELYVRGYFNIQSGLPFSSADNRFNLFAFQSASATIASLSVRRSGNADLWSITSVAGTWYASSGPSMNRWYCVEFYAKIDSTAGILRMWVDGVLVLERTGLNTASAGSITQVRTGLVYVSGITQRVNVYSDCFAISNTYIGPESG